MLLRLGKKKIKGIKRAIAVDETGRILAVEITSANENDGKIGIRLMSEVIRNQEVDIVIADKGFRGRFVDFINDILGKTIYIGNKIYSYSRYVVERTFAWLGNFNRLNKCYEHTISSAKAMVVIASIMMSLKRLC